MIVLDVLQHRAQTLVTQELFLKWSRDGFKVYLGHRRLSIIDLDPKSNQPFESDLKKLGLTLTPNTLAIERLLSQQLLDVDDQTFYNEIKIFPPMSFMELDLKSNTRTIKKYWDFTAPVLEKTFGDRKEVFRELLLDSLNCGSGAMPLGTLLSGGLDSSAITTLIHEHLNDQIQSFSVVSDEKKYSEESFVDLLVKNKNISNRKLRFVPDEALTTLKQCWTCKMSLMDP
ncbi:MAG: hypothetical protein IPG07_17455 [Crocinitomicaceae bacterium]|nr:hypothetical protein [Crocinitomicaceae bacterium]